MPKSGQFQGSPQPGEAPPPASFGHALGHLFPPQPTPSVHLARPQPSRPPPTPYTLPPRSFTPLLHFHAQALPVFSSTSRLPLGATPLPGAPSSPQHPLLRATFNSSLLALSALPPHSDWLMENLCASSLGSEVRGRAGGDVRKNRGSATERGCCRSRARRGQAGDR